MSNPFLVLGGIAVGIVVAAFGVLQVPGWVSESQDAAALNDLSQLRAAQSAELAMTGTYARSLDDFAEGNGVTLSDGVKYKISDVGAGAERSNASMLWVRSASGKTLAQFIGQGQKSEGNGVVTIPFDAFADQPGAGNTTAEWAQSVLQNPESENQAVTARYLVDENAADGLTWEE